MGAGLKRLIDLLKPDSVLRTNLETVVAVNDDALPHDKRVTATFGADVRLKLRIFFRCEWRDKRLELRVDLDGAHWSAAGWSWQAVFFRVTDSAKKMRTWEAKLRPSDLAISCSSFSSFLGS
jgi:hypothetical protein